jgi:ankyrin repeat protein
VVVSIYLPYEYIVSIMSDGGGADACLSLIQAAEVGNLEEVRILLQKGANINATNRHGNTALIMACSNGKEQVVVELLQHDEVDSNYPHDDGWPALTMACLCGYTNIVVELLKHET